MIRRAAALGALSCVLTGASSAAAQGLDLAALLASLEGPAAEIVAAPAEHRLQVLLARVVRDPSGVERLERSSFGDPRPYFYPASAIKTTVAVAALVELNDLAAQHDLPLGVDTALGFRPLFPDEEHELLDPTHLAGGRITVGHEIRKLFLVSDNRAHNRLFELVGHEALHARLGAAGFPAIICNHRLSEFRSPADQRRSPSVELYTADGPPSLVLPERESQRLLSCADQPGVRVGEAHLAGGQRVEQPLDFSLKNRASLRDLQDLHVAILRPDLLEGRRGFPELTQEQRAFLARAMRQVPGESEDPRYDRSDKPDEWVKFLLPGLRRVVPAKNLLVYDKVGVAYGFVTENALVIDRRTGESFFLAASVYVNPDGVLNDDAYGYEELAYPFFEALGETLARSLGWG